MDGPVLRWCYRRAHSSPGSFCPSLQKPGLLRPPSHPRGLRKVSRGSKRCPSKCSTPFHLTPWNRTSSCSLERIRHPSPWRCPHHGLFPLRHQSWWKKNKGLENWISDEEPQPFSNNECSRYKHLYFINGEIEACSGHPVTEHNRAQTQTLVIFTLRKKNPSFFHSSSRVLSIVVAPYSFQRILVIFGQKPEGYGMNSLEQWLLDNCDDNDEYDGYVWWLKNNYPSLEFPLWYSGSESD